MAPTTGHATTGHAPTTTPASDQHGPLQIPENSSVAFGLKTLVGVCSSVVTLALAIAVWVADDIRDDINKESVAVREEFKKSTEAVRSDLSEVAESAKKNADSITEWRITAAQISTTLEALRRSMDDNGAQTRERVRELEGELKAVKDRLRAVEQKTIK